MKSFRLLLFIGIISLTSGCFKDSVKDGRVDRPGVAFTFDDHYIDNWYQYLPLLDSFGVKATFYISGYNRLNSAQKLRLKEIQRRGHEIAFHSTNHFNMKDYLNNKGMTQLMESEIRVGLDKMHQDGFYPTTFAYPYGQHTPALDNELMKYFKSVRALNGTNNLAKSLAKGCNNKMLHGLGIDESSNRPLDQLLQLVRNAKSGNACAVFVTHHINTPNIKMQLPVEKLRALIKEAYSLNMKFYTVSEISN